MAVQVFQEYGFHPLVQRWIIGQCLCVDERTVSSYGIRRDGDMAFLYLLSAKTAELTQQRYEEDQARAMLSSAFASAPADPGQGRKYNTLPSVSPKKGPGPPRQPRGGSPGSCLAPTQPGKGPRQPRGSPSGLRWGWGTVALVGAGVWGAIPPGTEAKAVAALVEKPERFLWGGAEPMPPCWGSPRTLGAAGGSAGTLMAFLGIALY